MKRIITAILLIVSFQLNAQVLNNQCESQTPCNALPICGTATVSIAPSYSTTAPYNVNPGGAGTCAGALGGTFTYTPNWVFFRFKCFTGGALNFAIIGNDLASDLDWAMWDITVSGCGSLSAGNLVECNAYPTAGAGGTGVQAAAAFGFEPTITLVAGNTYILGVARRNGGTVTTGFNINFAGTTANLTDNVAPALGSIVPFNACNPVTQLKVKMTKPIRCSQIQATDFNITGNPIFTATAGVPCPGCINAPATGANYSNVTDTVVIDFPVALAAGTYTLSLTGGVFPQPFLDICGNLANTVPTIVFTVPNPLTLTLGTSVNCGTGQYNDTAKATFGTTPYQFKAAGPGQTNTYGPGNVFTGLTGGNTYTITVRDANNCTASVVITHPPYIPMSLLTYKKNAPCNNQFMLDTLKVTQVNGGASPFYIFISKYPSWRCRGGNIICTW
ncbi:MAG: hypothetical protein IPG85_15845 [Bacteroidetes bacterium]|nr:hypothetical protein [Bacteroidota bacterium]